MKVKDPVLLKFAKRGTFAYNDLNSTQKEELLKLCKIQEFKKKSKVSTAYMVDFLSKSQNLTKKNEKLFVKFCAFFELYLVDFLLNDSTDNISNISEYSYEDLNLKSQIFIHVYKEEKIIGPFFFTLVSKSIPDIISYIKLKKYKDIL